MGGAELIYFNNGDGQFLEQVGIGTVLGSSGALALGDMDDTGTLDIVSNDSIIYIENGVIRESSDLPTVILPPCGTD